MSFGPVVSSRSRQHEYVLVFRVYLSGKQMMICATLIGVESFTLRAR